MLVVLKRRSLRCIQVIAGVLGRAAEIGQKQRLAGAAQGEITYKPAAGLVLAKVEKTDNDLTADEKKVKESLMRGKPIPQDVIARLASKKTGEPVKDESDVSASDENMDERF